MATQFFEKNKIDLDLGASGTTGAPTITITDSVATDTGQSYVDYMRNRDNDSGWGTTGSSDAAGTTIDVQLGDTKDIDAIILTGINWKNFTIQYYDPNNSNALTNFSPAIAETAWASSVYSKTALAGTLTKVTTNRLKIVINSCQGGADLDKLCAQIILTLGIGQLSIEPAFVTPLIAKNRRVVTQISGKAKVQQSYGGVSMQLLQDNVILDADLTLQENLFSYVSGFLIWPSGGTTTQFPTQRIGFRPQDIYLVKPTNEYRPEWNDGRYKNGMPIDLQLVEIA